eukprot:1870465-Prymnesium_polylepis.1
MMVHSVSQLLPQSAGEAHERAERRQLTRQPIQCACVRTVCRCVARLERLLTRHAGKQVDAEEGGGRRLVVVGDRYEIHRQRRECAHDGGVHVRFELDLKLVAGDGVSAR